MGAFGHLRPVHNLPELSIVQKMNFNLYNIILNDLTHIISIIQFTYISFMKSEIRY